MESSHYVVGIDLGTSNCAAAYADLTHGRAAKVVDLPISQLQRLGGAGESLLLPSCLYAPTIEETASGGFPSEQGDWVVGEFARSHGARIPGRLITSAKSWLCHPGVDRTAPILPWGAGPGLPKLSPVDASARLLEQIARSWNQKHPGDPLQTQQVIVTVPASFDEVARALTVNAIRAAGLKNFTLIEEPQAAFYDFTARHQTTLGHVLQNVRLVLVIDVGGGTTDFTLVQVAEGKGVPALRRIAVGDHLMLGGDNMDAALARRIEEQFLAKGKKLSPNQWTQLLLSARGAKEKLLEPEPPEELKIAIASEGSKLLGSTLSGSVSLSQARETILEGFFPATSAAPARRSQGGIQEMGLPYVQDPAITKHLASFLRKHAAAAFEALGELSEIDPSRDLPRPDAILLNGGVFNSRTLSERLIDVVSSWWPERQRIPLLEHDSLDLAVARGAAYYGLVRQGLGERISGGTAHAFYVGLAAKKEQTTAQAVCLIPRGFEEGSEVELKDRAFNLTVGKPVQFPLFTTTSDRVDRAGDVITINDDLDALPPIHTVLKTNRPNLSRLPVHLRARLTEIGTVELWCVSGESGEQWRLEFELRGAAAAPEVFITESMPARFGEARRMIEAIYGGKGQPKLAEPSAGLPQQPKHLWAGLESVLGRRDGWRVAVLRELWSALIAGAGKRRRTADHEKVYLQLLGHTLRPGYGYPLDEWRCEQSFKLFPDFIEFHREKPNWSEFWILWRRIAGGLSEASQSQIWGFLKPNLQLRIPGKRAKDMTRPKGPQPEGLDEMVRTAASLENLDPVEKVQLGDMIADCLQHSQDRAGGPWAWSLGRIGARVPIRGSLHQVVQPQVAGRWIQLLRDLGPGKIEGAPFALVQLARLSSDRSRNIPDELRADVLKTLHDLNSSPSWLRPVREVVQLEGIDEARALGDTLPAGLQLA